MNVGYQREFPCFPSLKGFEGLLLSFKWKIPYFRGTRAGFKQKVTSKTFIPDIFRFSQWSTFQIHEQRNCGAVIDDWNVIFIAFNRIRYNWIKGVPGICRRTVNMQRTHVEMFVKRRKWWNIPWIYRSKTIINWAILFIFSDTRKWSKIEERIRRALGYLREAFAKTREFGHFLRILFFSAARGTWNCIKVLILLQK